MIKKGIIGAGGFANEVYWSLDKKDRINTVFFVDDEYYTENNKLILPLSKFNPDEYEIVVAVGNPQDRKKIIERLPKETKYFTHIHSSCLILGNNVEIGEGSIICAGVIITTNIKLGKHTHLNLHTTIGHDCKIGDYFTTAPGAKISGNCVIDDLVYVGTNSSIKEKLTICDNVTVGMNGAVIKDINKPGTYVGVPVNKIK
jgi:sugar O-acyltransferase (sialic acid O-acetyltransferase NeuD family)